MEAKTPLKRVLLEQGRRQDWLAAQIGVHESQVSRWVNGKHVPADATRLRVADVLGMNPDEVWPAESKRAA